MNPVQQKADPVQKAIEAGYTQQGASRTMTFGGREVTAMTHTTKPAKIVERILRGVVAAAAMIPPLTTVYVGKAARRNLEIAAHGVATKTLYIGPKEPQWDEGKLGYNPVNRDSIVKYINKNPQIYASLRMTKKGDYYLPETRNAHHSGFLLIPKDQIDTQTRTVRSASYIDVWNAKKPSETLEGAELHRMAEAWSAQREDMEQAMDKKAEELVLAFSKKHDVSAPTDAQKKNFKEALMRGMHRAIVVIDPANKHGRFYPGSLDMNDYNTLAGFTGALHGIRYDFGTNTQKLMDEIKKAPTNDKIGDNQPFAQSRPSHVNHPRGDDTDLSFDDLEADVESISSGKEEVV